MKNRFFLSLVALSAILIMLSSYNINRTGFNPADEINMPEDVKVVLDNKCYGCHNSEAKADKAKEKLLLDKINDLSKLKQISALSKIEEVVEKGEMPPEKFLEKYPDKVLTEEEGDLIKEWSVSTADMLLK